MGILVRDALTVDSYRRTAAEHFHEHATRANLKCRMIISDVPALQHDQIVVTLANTAVGIETAHLADLAIGGFDQDLEHGSHSQLTMSAPAFLRKSSRRRSLSRIRSW